MAQYSDTLANAWAGATEGAIGTSPKLRIYNGTIPANTGAALSGNTLLASGDLPSDWLGTAASRAVAKNGTWTVLGAAAGTATWYTITATDGTTRHIQGPISELGMSTTTIAVGITYTVNTATLTFGGA